MYPYYLQYDSRECEIIQTSSHRQLLWCPQYDEHSTCIYTYHDINFSLTIFNLLTADPGILMYNQAKYGPVDVITGDYLAGRLGQKNHEQYMYTKTKYGIVYDDD